MRESNQAFYRTAENRTYPYEGFYCNYHTLIVVHSDPRSLQQFRTRLAGGDAIRVTRQSLLIDRCLTEGILKQLACQTSTQNKKNRFPLGFNVILFFYTILKPSKL